MLMTPLSLLSLVLLSTSSYAIPLTRRALPTFKVVTNAAGSEDACTPDQVNTLQAALAEGASLATKAATALSKTGAGTSDAATKWLGTITAANLATQVTKRLSRPAAAFTSTLTPVANFDTDDAVYFFCPDKNDPDNDPCVATSDAVTENILTGSTQNTIALCDPFFDGATLAADKTAYLAAVAGDATTVKFPSPRSKGVILVHEAQHSLPILQSTTKSDNLQDRPGASTPEGSSKLPSSKQKQTNAENWALLAYLAEVDPARLTSCDTSSGSTGKRAVSSSKGGAVCPLPSNSTSSSSVVSSSSSVASTSSVSSSATLVSSSAPATSPPVTTSAAITSKSTASAPATSTPSATAKSTTAPATPPAAPATPPAAPATPPAAPATPPAAPATPPAAPATPPAAPATPPAAPAKPPTAPATPPKAPAKPPTVPVKPSKPKKGIKLIRRL